MRLFVAIRPPETVLDQVAAAVDGFGAGQPAQDHLRWTARDKWHVTMRFLGEVAEPEPVVAALEGRSFPAVEATLGPATRLLGRQVLCLPVAGLQELAAAVGSATADLGSPPDARPFRGHLTLARARGRKNLRSRSGGPADLVGVVVSATWTVDEIVLVRSHLTSNGARYQDLHTVRLTR